MAAVLTAAITDKVATLELDNAAGFVVGEHVHVYNVGNHFDGPHVLLTVNTTTDVITYSTGGQDVDEFTVTGGLVYAEVTWIDADDVEVWLGFAPATANDVSYLEECTNAANDWCYRRRHNAGYNDNPTVAPSRDVKQGTVMYAGALYRERGSVDGFQSFESMTPAPLTFSMGRILQLLGCNRPQVG
jgi:hypothetical protein